jgi:hypothetical protein
MTPNKFTSLRPTVEWHLEAQIPSEFEELAFLFYALLYDEDLEEVFGEFLVPAESVH